MPKQLTETVAAEIRAELARRNISRTDAAAALGISRNLLWQRLRGESPFTVDELEAMAELIGVPVSTFLRENTPASAATGAA